MNNSLRTPDNSPLKTPGEGTGPTIHAHFRGIFVGRVPSRGELDGFKRAAKPPAAVRRHPVAVQIITWLILATQVLAPFSNHLFAAEKTVQPLDWSRPAPVLTPTNVVVNRTVPAVQPPSSQPVFSDPPTDQEFFHARVLAGPLVPIGAATTPDENRALAAALLAFTQRDTTDDASALTKFLDEHPQSAWRASLLTYLGIPPVIAEPSPTRRSPSWRN